MDYALCPPLRVPEGTAIAGGSMDTYLAGTTTPLATYADPAGTPNPTTVPLDTAGRPGGAVYLATTDLSGNPIAYKFIVKDSAGQTLYTQDQVRAGGLHLFDLGGVVNLEDFPTLQDAVTAIGTAERTLVVGTAVAVGADTTVPGNVALLFLGEGMLAPASGVTLTIDGPMTAPELQVFGTDGAVVFGVGRRRGVDPRWWGAVPGGAATANTTAFQAAFDAISVLGADTTANPKADTGGQVVVAPGQYDIDGEIATDSDAVELIGSGVSTRINLQGAGKFRFGTYDPVTGKGGAGSHNPKHVRIRDLFINAEAGHNAGNLVEVPMSHNLVVERVRISSSEPTNPITGLFLQSFQYVNVKDSIILTNRYPLHLYMLASAPQYEAHVRITGTELFLNGNVQPGACAALHIEAETGRTNPIWDFTMERCLLAAFTQDPAEADTIGLRITNPNANAALQSAVLHGVMFEQCETLADAATYTTNDTSHILFDGCPFLGKAGVTLAGWRGNDTKSRPVFRGCTFTNMQDMLVQSDPVLGEGNNATGITGNLFASVTSVRYDGLERPFMNQTRFRNGGSAAVGNNDTIPHGLIAAPSRVVVAGQNSLYNVSVASQDATNVTVGVRDVTTGALVGTPVTVYWEAAV